KQGVCLRSVNKRLHLWIKRQIGPLAVHGPIEAHSHGFTRLANRCYRLGDMLALRGDSFHCAERFFLAEAIGNVAKVTKGRRIVGILHGGVDILRLATSHRLDERTESPSSRNLPSLTSPQPFRLTPRLRIEASVGNSPLS